MHHIRQYKFSAPVGGPPSERTAHPQIPSPAITRFPARPCPVCGCTRSTLLFEQSFDQLSGALLLDGYDVVICEQCGAGFADDIPPQSAFDGYYRDLSKYDYADRGGAEPPGAEDRFQDIAAALGRFIPSPHSRVLEIGCASGQLLKVLKEWGFSNVEGVDPSPGCIRAAFELYGVPGVAGTVFSIPQPEVPYDVLILIGVMEHIRDLECAVDRFHTLLREEGLVYLEVPDASRYVADLDAPFQEFSVEHINFFSKTSLTNLMCPTRYEVTLRLKATTGSSSATRPADTTGAGGMRSVPWRRKISCTRSIGRSMSSRQLGMDTVHSAPSSAAWASRVTLSSRPRRR